MTAEATRGRFAQTPIVILLLVVATIAFFAGRRTAGPSGGSGGSEQAAEHAEGGHAEEEHAEEGVITFGEAALKLANLTVEPVAMRSLQTRLTLTGTVEPNLSGVVKVTPRVAGKITAVRANVGDSVAQGAVLATLASTELAEAQASYRQAGARIRVAQANLKRQRQLAGLGEFGRHKVEEARQREIQAHGELNQANTELVATKNEIAEARSDRAALEGEVAKAENEVASAESEITEAQAKVRALQAAMAQAESATRTAESKFNRYNRLIIDELVSRQDWEQAKADLEQSRSNIDAARANISQGEAEVATAKAHKAAAQSQVRATQSRVQQASDKIETLISRQRQVEERVATAQKQDAIAEEALKREERVYKGGFLTSKEILDAEAAVRQAQFERAAAGDTIRLLGGAPGGGNVIAVTAPISGRVTDRTVTLGETVDPAKSLLTIINLNSVWAQLSVPQADLPHVRVGQSVTITSDTAPGRMFSGAVTYIGDVVDETTRTVKARAVIQNWGNALRPETFVRGRLAAGTRSEALAVPSEAVQTLEGKSVVFVQGEPPGVFATREVQTGDTTGGLTIITSGLEAGAKVVTRGAFTVKAQAMKAELGHEH